MAPSGTRWVIAKNNLASGDSNSLPLSSDIPVRAELELSQASSAGWEQ